ncbi:hypothetical protein JQ629_09450 [Bradyrhizobium sp. AUGA SZCCT0222]|uniref:hypothetical protein n=1 Tax=Bradyrhizobium sp. AUGA SZCCT0222 TaxID=2807668 RepID=UPI001BA769B3|nr:hypothetical protein [Bradyrhizobium sp. AUGA SZCCT0222]MBR1267729.1 hypothetical protein [Bradyrhizobium sp. AUGA SZCCT0222]
MSKKTEASSPTQTKPFGWSRSVETGVVSIAAAAMFLVQMYRTDEPLLIKWLPVLPTY